jgi:aspartate racemase
VGEQLGGFHSARILLNSVDFHEIEQYQRAGCWESATQVLARAAAGLEASGADFLVLCTNTMHKVAPQIEAGVGIPLLHIADATAGVAREAGLERVGLLGTRFTMEEDFYRGRLEHCHGLTVTIPEARGREAVHRIIYDELCLGRVSEASREVYRQISAELIEGGAEAIILACTEISMLLKESDVSIPLLDTAAIHARAAALLALESSPAQQASGTRSGS